MSRNKGLIAEARDAEAIHAKLAKGFTAGSELHSWHRRLQAQYKRLADALEAAQPRTVTNEREELLRILAGMDYEGGGMLRWHPSGEPNDAALRVADTILAAGFRLTTPARRA